MWAIRDSDGAETLHSIYPSWADSLEHLTVVTYVTQARYEAAIAELTETKKALEVAQKFARRHMAVLKNNAERMRQVESANNRYYSILQRYNLIGALPEQLDDTPIIDVKV
ncbi:hypothetical protein HOT57_gp65 [Pseudomonas phage phCDa]|uniref:Uncharacterized protein n=1 Tax=Pseudomonas phage phCDa TaxID=2268587 RepID=A0A2Z5H987_9CAUD|nr:hypothetical protein HOT57_gp65 [Pseudomonas phage phCDa]AXC36509.1 hypothetical protein phCDa_65 [Pseudomonas phage phCDa]